MIFASPPPPSRRRRRRSLATSLATALALAAAAAPSSLLASPLLLLPRAAEAGTDVRWTGNENVPPEHRDAHDAPRSQKYWDEHGIERPDYAKTDAEIASERRRKNGDGGVGGGGGGGMGLLGGIFLASAIVVVVGAAYANITGDWDTIMNNPVGSFVGDSLNRMADVSGSSGHRLGTSAATKKSGFGTSDDEARRLARLARFDNPRNMLDSMKSD